MSEWRTFLAEFRAPKSDVAVLLTTFLLTLLWDLTVAIEVGMVLAAFLFMRRMAEVTNISVLTHELQDPKDDFENDPNAVRRRAVPAGVEVYEITGPFFFGAAETFRERLGRIAVRPKVLILRMRHVPRSTRPGCTRCGIWSSAAAATARWCSSPTCTPNPSSPSSAPACTTSWARKIFTETSTTR